MDQERVEGLIDALHAARHDVAAQNAALAESEIARHALKAEIVGEMTSKGIAVTPAEKAASQDTRYITFGRNHILAELGRDRRLADAEALRFRVQLALLEAEAAIRDPVQAVA